MHEKESKTRVNIAIRPKLHGEGTELARKLGMSFSEYIAHLIRKEGGYYSEAARAPSDYKESRIPADNANRHETDNTPIIKRVPGQGVFAVEVQPRKSKRVRGRTR